MSEQRQSWTRAVVAGLAACALLAAVPARADSPVAGVVVSLEGHPQLKAVGSDSYKRTKINDMVHEGDTLKTGHGERVGVAFVGGAELRVNEDSVFTVQSGGSADKPTSVFTSLGDAWTRLISGHAGPGIQVRSPVAVAAVRGTEADIDVSDRMAVKVYEGHVDVMNDKGKTTLTKGQQSSVSGAGQAPAPASKMSPTDYRSWQDGVKPKDLDKSLKLLNAAADKTRTLEIIHKNKDGSQKKTRYNLEKK
jgi:hypothetical protein